jgi:hypothetical protein
MVVGFEAPKIVSRLGANTTTPAIAGSKGRHQMASQQKALATLPQNPITALFSKFDETRYNVLAPVTHMLALPVGTRIVVTEVRINPDPASKEVFPIAGGQLMPSKVSLDKIAAAAGISWIEERRQDNGKHPHYCEMFVRGRITDFDGTVRECTGVKAVDLREDAGSEQMGKDYSEIVTKAAKGNRDPSGQLMEARKFIQEIAASKARNRAIASALGIKRSYTREELLRPIIVPKLTVDPTSQMAQTAIMANMMGGIDALFGAKREKIVDAKFEESPAAAAAPPGDGGEGGDAGGGVSPPSPSPADAQMEAPSMEEEPEHDENTGEVALSPEEIKARVGSTYTKLRKAYPKLSNKDWVKLVRDATGKPDYTGMTPTDLGKIDFAVDSAIKTLVGGK